MAIEDEEFVIKNSDGSVTLDAYARLSRDQLKQRCRELARELINWQIYAMCAATDGGNELSNVREPHRSSIERLMEAYSDER